MCIDGWQYYVHAAIPSTAPHEKVNIEPIKNGSIWKMQGRPLLARWISDWDCGYETKFWYVIKDTPFDISLLKAKRRYEINKGNKYFYVKEINPSNYGEDLFRITYAAYETYPVSYRPHIEKESFISVTKKWNFYKTYAAFSVEDNKMYAYACLIKKDDYIDFTVLKADPQSEKLSVNAAVVDKILEDHNDFLSSGGYICDGSRSIQHETAFQDYLEKYFGFRKAYCKLNIVYRPFFGLLIKLLYPFKSIFSKGNTNVFRKISALLKMQEYVE